MQVNEVKKLNWISVSDWSELSRTYIDFYGDAYVGERDVEFFVENLFRVIARRLNISYSELIPILREENSAFYSEKVRLFGIFDGVFKDSDCLLELQRLLRIPDVMDVNKSDVDKILDSFSALTDMEKLEVLQRLGAVSVKVEYCNVCRGDQ